MRPERGSDGADLRATPCDVLAFDNAHLTRDSVKMPTAATSIEGTMHEIGTFTVSEGETRKNEEGFSAFGQCKIDWGSVVMGHCNRV